ncbi:hypothetical protein PMAYCL1PPCAC_02415, partial [Pristionchus mayeri]
LQMLSSVSTPLARALSTSSSSLAPIKNVTIIGAGLMGAGIAQVSANAKLNVVLVDQNDKVLEKSRASIDKSLARVAKKKFPDSADQQKSFVADTMKHLKVSTNTSEAVSQADLVIEAIVENIDIKRKLFAEVEAAVKSSAIITTNTSSLRLSDIAANLKNKSQFGGLHFFNPVPMMKLLEVVRHDDTSDATYNSLMEYGKSIGKVTVSCKDTPGFIVNRLLIPYMYEALRMADRGDASFKDIDTAMKLGAGYPMGPFELCDYVGLDTTLFIGQGWAKNYPNEPSFKPSPTLEKLVKEGKLGRKTGEGFYKY